MKCAIPIFVFCIGFSCAFNRCAEAQSFPIRRSTPYERGDQWRTVITSIKTSKGSVTVAGDEQRMTDKETTSLSAVVTVDNVDEDGYALVWLAKIVRFVGPSEAGSSKVLLRPGTVILFDRIEEYMVTHENGAPLDDVASSIKELLRLPERNDDAPFEPLVNVEVNEQWHANVESMRATILANGPPQLREHPEVLSIKASGELTATKVHRETTCLEISLKTNTGITEELQDERQSIIKADQEVEERFLIPTDYATDFLDKRTVLKDVLLTRGRAGNPSLDVTQTTTTTEKRTYLEFKRGGVRSLQLPLHGGSVLDDLLVGFDFDESSASGSGKSARIQSHGRIDEQQRVKSSGHVAGKVGESMVYDGKDDHVNVESALDVLRSTTEAVTVACWVKSPPKKIQFLFDVGFYGDSSMSLVVVDKIAKFHLSPIAGGVGLHFPLVATDWTHVAVTWDGTLQRAYVNGKLIKEGKTTSKGKLDHASIGGNPFLIGSQSKPPSREQRYFAGQMDEFALWTRALDPAEIATVFAKGNQGQSLFDP